MSVTIEELQHIKDARRRIDALTARRAMLRESMMQISPNLSGMPRGGQTDRMAEYAARLDELDGQYAEAIMALYTEQLRVELALDALPAQQATIMRLRYVDGYGWRRVAREAHYAESYCRKIHDAAERRLKKERK